jgi:prevent-host-death family protein
MPKTISVSHLRVHIRQVLNEVIYGRAEYIVEKFGEPSAAIISIDDYRLLQEAKQRMNVSLSFLPIFYLPLTFLLLTFYPS